MLQQLSTKQMQKTVTEIYYPHMRQKYTEYGGV